MLSLQEKELSQKTSSRRPQKADVPVYKDEKLAEELSRLDLGDQIPEELYQIVAES